MARVICTLENASELISGVKFTADRGQMISEEITDEVAAHFASIPGYSLVAPAAAPAASDDGKKRTAKAPAAASGGATDPAAAPAGGEGSQQE